MWLKYREKFSTVTCNWKYKYLGNVTKAQANIYVEDCWLKDLVEKFNWSEHYRGVDYKIIARPPAEIIQNKIDETKMSIKILKATLKELENLLRPVAVKSVYNKGKWKKTHVDRY